MQEQGFLFTGQREIEATPLEEFVRGGNRHDFKHILRTGSIDTGLDKGFANSLSLMIGGDRQTAQFGQFDGLDFESGKAENLAFGNSDKTVSGQIFQFVPGTWQQSALSDEGLNEMA